MPKDLGQPGPLEQRTAPQAGALGARMSAPNTLQANQAQLVTEQGAEKRSMLDNLLTPETLIKLGLAVAGGLSGNQNLQAAGLGLGMGTFQGAGEQAQQSNAEQAKRIDDLTGMIEKQQQRMTSLLQSQPGLFVDENGENLVAPGEWQNLLALSVPVNPAAMLSNARTTKASMKQFEVAQTMIQVGMQQRNPEAVAEGLSLVNTAGNLGWTDQYIDRLSSTDSSNIVRTLLEANEPASVMAALQYAAENSVSMLSPEALKLLLPATAEDSWNIDSIDDQIKADAYGALKWFNDQWMNGDTDGQSNRILYRTNPIEALKIAFADNPESLTVMKKVFPATAEGDEIDRAKMTALMQAASMLPEMQLYMSNILGPNATDADKANALFDMGQSVHNMSTAGLGLVRINNSVGSLHSVGARYGKPRGIPQGNWEQIGSDIVTMAHMLARKDGVDYSLAPLDVRSKYDDQAFQKYDEFVNPTPAPGEDNAN